jgi:uncharacterized glyoxalase superfamily protein PhnB
MLYLHGRGYYRNDPRLVVASADVAHDELKARGVEVSDVEDLEWGRFVYFSDPDGNSWALQELPDYSKYK